MGINASVIDQKRLYHALVNQYNQSSLQNDTEGTIFENANSILKEWQNILKLNVKFCKLIDLEVNVESAFQGGLTPLIVDTSIDDKVCTFYSYQPDVIILEAKQLIFEAVNKSLTSALEIARRILVNAMKFGKLLVIRLASSAPNFRTLLNDEAIDESLTLSNGNQLSFFPKEVFIEGGKQLHSDFWINQLFREEDMKPHKNIAICRESFRVCVATQTPLEKINEYLFGESTENYGGLPNKRLFQIVDVLGEEEEGNDEDSQII